MLASMASYLVTGGAGFIGSNLADALIEAGHSVRIIDNLSTGKRSNLNPRADFHEVDFTDLEAIKPLFVGIEGVFHLGARPSIPYSVEFPVESTATNIIGTLNVLVAARDAKVRRVVYSASSSAYGPNAALPSDPSMPADPASPYAIQKYVGELYCRQFAQLYGLETVCLRYFNVYGPRMNDQGAYVPVFTFFIRQTKAGEPLTVFGDGEQTRDFTHVSDVVSANIKAMVSLKVGQGEVLNVGGGGEPATINQIVKIFGGIAKYLPSRAGDVRHSKADITLTTELIEWTPQTKFVDGLASVLREHGIEPVI